MRFCAAAACCIPSRPLSAFEANLRDALPECCIASPPLSEIEAALRAALPECTVLPESLRHELLLEKDDDKDALLNVDLAIPRRP